MRTTRTIPGSLSSDTLIHCIGDPHVPVLPTVRQTKFLRDVANGLLPTPAVRVILGDLSNENGSNVNASADDTTAVAFANSISPAVSWYTLIGNHDIWRNNRTAAAAAAAYGQASLDQVVDLPNVRLILVNPDTMVLYPSDQNTIGLTSAKLTWLAAQLAGTTKDCIVFCHAPLKNTVTDASADASTIFDSNTQGFFVVGPNQTDDTEIRTVLGAASNAVAWVSGHTHEDPFRTTTTMWKTTTCGSRTVAAINVPVLYYITPAVDASDTIYSMYLVHKGPGTKTVEVHLRNHSTGTWDGNDEGRVVSLVAS